MATGFTVASNEHLIRTALWSKDLRQLLLDDLYAMKFIRLLNDYPDMGSSSTYHIPSLGEAGTADFAEGQAIQYSRLDTGDFTFSPDQYKYSAHSISEKFKRDSFYASEVYSSFVPRQHRALMEALETRIFNRANAGQTASDLNVINGANHRFVASGTSEVIALKDFALANYALRKANVPMTNCVAILDPSTAYTIETQANIVNLLSPTPMWSNLVNTGMVTGFKFRFNIYGFDCYVSNYLPRDIAETINGRSTTVGVANMFFCAAGGDINPIVGAIRQPPTVHSEFNKDLQQTEVLTICEYGFKLYRPENMVIILTDTDQVA